MDDKNLQLASEWIGKSTMRAASQGSRQLDGAVRDLLSQRRLPEKGWSEAAVEFLLAQLSQLDSNQHVGQVGVGEREGRVYSSLVSRRHYHMSHGVGRSGNLSEVQPKAAGSSLAAQLSHRLAQDALHEAGLKGLQGALVVPVATGMSIGLCLSALRKERPAATHVLWPRIDQKSAFKAISMAGFTATVIDPLRVGDELVTNVAALSKALEEKGADSFVCVLSTTSCFAPRASDSVVELADLCRRWNVPHVVNNAYGVAVAPIARELSRAIARGGRIDYIVQSTDKNFLVPVGGAIIASPSKERLKAVAAAYPGRASLSPALDLLVTLLQLGREGWRRVLQDRESLWEPLQLAVQRAVAPHGGRLLSTPGNAISLAFTVGAEGDAATEIGARLFYRSVSGMRVVPSGVEKSVDGVAFAGYGAHCPDYPFAYATVACAVGLLPSEVDTFSSRLSLVLAKSSASSSTAL